MAGVAIRVRGRSHGRGPAMFNVAGGTRVLSHDVRLMKGMSEMTMLTVFVDATRPRRLTSGKRTKLKGSWSCRKCRLQPAGNSRFCALMAGAARRIIFAARHLREISGRMLAGKLAGADEAPAEGTTQTEKQDADG